MAIRTILIIGGEGFIGKAVARTMSSKSSLNESCNVRTTSRRKTHSEIVSDAFYLDLEDASTFHGPLADAEVVIHCARDIGGRGESTYPIGLSELLKTAKLHGVKRFIYLSSVSVYGDTPGTIFENSKIEPKDPYGHCKARAEAICRAEASNDFSVVILRPSRVYGPDGEEWTSRYVRDLLAGRLRLSNQKGTERANLVYVDDLAQFCADLTLAAPSGLSVFNVAGNGAETWNDYYNLLGRSFGFNSIKSTSSIKLHELRRLMRSTIRKGIKLVTLLAKRLPGLSRISAIPRLSKNILNYNFYDEILKSSKPDAIYDITYATQWGFRPRTTLTDGLTRVRKWHTEGQI